MIETMLEPSFEGDGVLANDLLSECHKGFPKENVRRLIASPNPATQATAAFLMTFWGFELHPFVSEIASLLDSKHWRTRFDTVEVLRSCTTPEDGEILGRVLLLLDDEDQGVRWGVAQFIRYAPPWQLKLGLRHAAMLSSNPAFEELNKVHGQHFRATTKKLTWLLAHPDPIVRRFGAAIAIKPGYVIDEQFVAMAEQSDDAEVKNIAASCRRSHMTPIYAVWSSSLSA
jgi:hypothetical protein